MSAFTFETRLAFARRGFGGFLNLSMTATLSGRMLHRIQTISTGGEDLYKGDLSGTPGFYVVRNDNATRDVDLYLDVGLSKMFATLRPGQFAAWKPATSATLYAKAYTDPCDCSVFVCEALTDPVFAFQYSPYQNNACNAFYSLSCGMYNVEFFSEGSNQTTEPTLAVQANAELKSRCLTAAYESLMPSSSEYVMLMAFLGSAADTAYGAIDASGADKAFSLAGAPALIPTSFGQEYYIAGAVGGEELLSLWGMTV